MNKIFYVSVLMFILFIAMGAPQEPEATETNPVTETVNPPEIPKEPVNNTKVIVITKTITTPIKDLQNTEEPTSITFKLYKFVAEPIQNVLKIPKVNEVLRNIGTCLVNGAMELFSFYLPPTFLPLIASAAGFVIPFEPVVMLKERMPVNTYRRAFKTAMNSFLSNFDSYKVDDDHFDPYMTRRFNRRFMDDKPKKKTNIELEE